jgi:hypothetical protein
MSDRISASSETDMHSITHVAHKLSLTHTSCHAAPPPPSLTLLPCCPPPHSPSRHALLRLRPTKGPHLPPSPTTHMQLHSTSSFSHFHVSLLSPTLLPCPPQVTTHQGTTAVTAAAAGAHAAAAAHVDAAAARTSAGAGARAATAAAGPLPAGRTAAAAGAGLQPAETAPHPGALTGGPLESAGTLLGLCRFCERQDRVEIDRGKAAAVCRSWVVCSGFCSACCISCIECFHAAAAAGYMFLFRRIP